MQKRGGRGNSLLRRTARDEFRARDGRNGQDEDFPGGYDGEVDFKVPRRLVARSKEDIGVANTKYASIDTHEMLKKEMFGSANGDSDNHFEKNRPSPFAPFGASDNQILFDSWNKQEAGSNPANGTYKFNIFPQGTSSDGEFTGTRDKIENIVSMRIHPFIAPLLAQYPYTLNSGANSALPILTTNTGAPTAGSLGVPLTQLPYGNRITLQINEFGRQAYPGPKGTYFHYMLEAEEYASAPSGTVDRLLLVPSRHEHTYSFTDPIKCGDAFTFIFRNPDITVNFPADVLYGAAAQVSGTLLQFNFTNHGLNIGDQIVIKGFKSGNPVLDAYLSNAPALIVGTGGYSANVFRLNPDVNVASFGADGTPIPSSTRININIAKNRMLMRIVLRSVVGRTTNYASL